jgi:nucleotide-binding universal stress UspA family protein
VLSHGLSPRKPGSVSRFSGPPPVHPKGCTPSIKDILVALSPRDERDTGRDFAVALAAQFGAQVTGVAYAVEHLVPFSMYPEFTSELMQRQRNEARKAADQARERFVEAAGKAGVRHEFHGATVTAQAATSDFAHRLRTADLAILTQHQPDNVENVGDAFAEAALFHSGRPMIIVPRDHAGNFSVGRLLIAWDAGIHAARAVAASMPLLRSATAIEVLTIREEFKGGDLRGNELVRHLRLHDLIAEPCTREDHDIPEAIIREAKLFRASLVIMGGYGHSRLREFVFGGATRRMLREMPVPVLMAH